MRPWEGSGARTMPSAASFIAVGNHSDHRGEGLTIANERRVEVTDDRSQNTGLSADLRLRANVTALSNLEMKPGLARRGFANEHRPQSARFVDVQSRRAEDAAWSNSLEPATVPPIVCPTEDVAVQKARNGRFRCRAASQDNRPPDLRNQNVSAANTEQWVRTGARTTLSPAHIGAGT